MPDRLKMSSLPTLDDPAAPAPSSTAKRPGVGWGPYAALIGGQGADAATTLMTEGQSNNHEAKPQGVKGALIGKAIGVPLMAVMMHEMAQRDHPTAAKVLGYILGGLGGGAAINNARFLKP